MTTPLTEPATARDLLFGDALGSAADALTASLHESGTVKRFIPGIPVLAAEAEKKVAEATEGQLSLNLVDIVAEGWKKFDRLRQAAQRSRDTHTEETVEMATHKINASHHPSVELYIDGRSVGTLEMTLQITVTMAGLLAVVEEGRLTTIKSGTCTAAASFTAAGIEVAKKQRKLDLPGAVRLRRGIALIDDAAVRAASAQVSGIAS